MPQRGEVVPEVPARSIAVYTSRVDGVKDAALAPRVVPEPRLDAEVPRDVWRARLRAVRGDWYCKFIVGVGRELVAFQGCAIGLQGLLGLVVEGAV